MIRHSPILNPLHTINNKIFSKDQTQNKHAESEFFEITVLRKIRNRSGKSNYDFAICSVSKTSKLTINGSSGPKSDDILKMKRKIEVKI